MSFNKSKTRQSAERYLAQGKIRAAINEYVFIVDNDPADYNTLNVLGDLYARVNEKDEAVDCFKRLAEHYNKQGFSQKAIAIYNKITRLKPDAVEVSAKLAPLYQMKGLMAEARSHYSVLAEYYKNNGKKLEALKIWQQIAELDPNNVEVFFTLAENYLQENYTEEAAEAFTEAGRRFSTQKNYEKAIHAYSKALEIHPLDIGAIEGLITCQITCGYYDEAIGLIETTLEEHPNNIDLMSLLLSCHIELSNYVESENTVIALVEREPANYRKFLDVVGLHLKNKDTVAATRMLSMCSEHLLVAGQGEELKTWIDEILAQNPEQVEALSLLVRLHAWQREDSELQAALIRMAESANANDDEENEKTALSQLVLMAPHETRFRERLEELGGSDAQVSFGYEEGGISIVEESEVPTFESFGSLSDNNEEATDQTVDFGIVEDISSLTSDTDTSSTGFAFVDTDQYFDASTESLNGNGHAESNGSNGFYPTIDLSEADVIAEPASPKSELEKSREAHLHQELESVDFYLNEGYRDLAIQTLDLLESQFGSHTEIESRRRQLDETLEPEESQVLEASEEVMAPQETEITEIEESSEYKFEAVTSVEESAVEANVEGAIEDDEIARQYVEEDNAPEIAETIQEFTPEISEVVEAAPVEEIAPVQETAEEVVAVEEIAPLEESGQIEVETAETSEISETFTGQFVSVDEGFDNNNDDEAAEISAHEDLQTFLSEELDESLDLSEAGSELSLFEEFRSGLDLEDAAPVADSDYETHYNMGTAYKEMGLFEDAVEEFQEAVKLVSPDEDGRRYLQCCHSLGHCFMEKTMPKLAQLWYEKALQSRDLTIEEKQALNYEIALAFEKQGKPGQAVEIYSNIYALDVTYRDVKDKLESLQG